MNKQQRRVSKHNKLIIKKYLKEIDKSKNDLKVIPKNTFYCYDYISSYREFKIKPCPFYYTIKIPKDERDEHIGIVAVGQNHIGGCKFINKTDDDLNGWGMLWDMCKECPII